jgi:hypothetical protein
MCGLRRAMCHMYPRLDGSLLVLQGVRFADDACYADQGLVLMPFFSFLDLKSRTNRTTLGSSGRKHPPVYLVVLLTDQGLSLMQLFDFGSEILDQSHKPRSFST